MNRLTILLVGVMLFGAMVAAGCRSGGQDGNGTAETTDVKTMDEYREEASREISGENAEGALEQLKKDIESEAGAGQ